MKALILIGNILSMSKSLGWFIDAQVLLTIQEIEHIAEVNIKGQKQLAFTLKFTSNISLPSFIGLGRRVSIGFGMLFQNRNNYQKNKT